MNRTAAAGDDWHARMISARSVGYWAQSLPVTNPIDVCDAMITRRADVVANSCSSHAFCFTPSTVFVGLSGDMSALR